MHIYSYKFLLPLLFFCAAVAGFAQEPSISEESGLKLNTEEVELTLPAERPVETVKQSSTVAVLFQLIFSLAAVCALIYGVLYFIKRSKHFTAADDPFLKNVAALHLTPNKSLYIVTLIDKAYLIGAADASISLLAELTDKELIDAMNLHAAQAAGPKQNFNTFLHTFFPAARQKVAESSPFDSFLTKQRERLQKTVGYSEETTAEYTGGASSR